MPKRRLPARVVIHEKREGQTRKLVVRVRSGSELLLARIIVWAAEPPTVPAAALLRGFGVERIEAKPPLAVLDSRTFAINRDGGKVGAELLPGEEMLLAANLSLSPEDWSLFQSRPGVAWNIQTTPLGERVSIEEISLDGHCYYRAPVIR